ncbi:uncharacterized protein LOC143622724 [Bidens hawaiensis]|uniref:uncharacterized protein LOC143622724 n=1 Tax=Bidens hawaiensis TaxID=980011 RepID=UPI004049B126
MKTVSGKIVSTKPVSLSKAANVLANFVTSDNGVSQPVAAYLRRASAAFDELVYFKKHHKLKKKSSKEEDLTKSDISHRSLEEYEVKAVENGGTKKKFDQDSVEVDEHRIKEVEGKSRKKEKKRKKSEGSLGNKENDGIKVKSREDNETVKEKSEEKKRKKSEGSLGNKENDGIKVESKENNEIVNEKSEEKKKKKKRKNAEVDGGEMDNSVRSKRKKRRKIKADD